MTPVVLERLLQRHTTEKDVPSDIGEGTMNSSTTRPETDSQEGAAPPSGVKRLFPDVHGLNRAVTRLTRLSVPVDEIHVYVLDDHGEPRRELTVEDEPGTLAGALIGAVIGAAVGVIIVALAQLGPFERINDAIYGLDTIQGAFRLAAVLAFIGVPIGGILNMSRWNARKEIHDADRNGDGFLVVVETEELADLAERVLDEVGGRPVMAS